MSDIKDALGKARSDAQDLHKKILESSTREHAALRTDLKNAGASAQSLAASLKTVAANQHADAAKHVKQAAEELEDAAKYARDAANAGEEQVKQNNRAMLAKVREAVHNLSEAVAAQRAKMVKA